jgi:hypothetical protein
LPLNNKARFLVSPYLREQASKFVPLANELKPADCHDLALFSIDVLAKEPGQAHVVHSDFESMTCQDNYVLSFWLGLEGVTPNATLMLYANTRQHEAEPCHEHRPCPIPPSAAPIPGPQQPGEYVAWASTTWHASLNAGTKRRLGFLAQFHCPSFCTGPRKYTTSASNHMLPERALAPSIPVAALLDDSLLEPEAIPLLDSVRPGKYIREPTHFDSSAMSIPWQHNGVSTYTHPVFNKRRTKKLLYITMHRAEWHGNATGEAHDAHVEPTHEVRVTRRVMCVCPTCCTHIAVVLRANIILSCVCVIVRHSR